MKTTRTVKPSAARAKRSATQSQSPRSRQLERLLRLMIRETGKAIQFEVAAAPGSQVYVAGTFNDWNPTTHPLPHRPDLGAYKAALLLPSGTHEYKYVVNGVWQLDTHWPHRVTTPLGTLNNVIRV
jgi:1,4-alpha-glucan branching enzyme